MARVDGPKGVIPAAFRTLRGVEQLEDSIALIDQQQDPAAMRALAEGLRRSVDDPPGLVRIGVGDPIDIQHGLATSLDEAERAVRLPRRLGWRPGVVLFQDVLMFDVVDRDERLSSHLLSVLGPLLDHDRRGRSGDLVETLETYYSSGWSRAAASEALSIHPHTLDYRLARIEALLGVPVRAGSSSLLMDAALAAMRLRRTG